MAWPSLTSDQAPRFLLLFVAIIAELMVSPFFAASEFGLEIARGWALLVLLGALWAAGVRRASILLFAPAIVIHLIDIHWDSPALMVATLLFRVICFGYATALIVWHVLRRSDVTADTIAGAACAYALIAAVWGNLYVLLELFHPGSFQIPAGWRAGPAGHPGPALIYFSFITLTTVGYGDVTPAWPGAGGLAVAEAVVGQLYLAVTIARLVGLHTMRRS